MLSGVARESSVTKMVKLVIWGMLINLKPYEASDDLNIFSLPSYLNTFSMPINYNTTQLHKHSDIISFFALGSIQRPSHSWRSTGLHSLWISNYSFIYTSLNYIKMKGNLIVLRSLAEFMYSKYSWPSLSMGFISMDSTNCKKKKKKMVAKHVQTLL